MKIFFNEIRFVIELIIIKILFFILSIIPMKIVSFLGGKIFRYIGPFSKQNSIAISNYKKIFPSHSESEINLNIKQSWENVGKTIFEISILEKIVDKKNKKIHIEGLENINLYLEKNKPVIFFGIHQSNWEICVPIINQLGFNVGAIYRHINNKYLDKIIYNKRNSSLVSKTSFYTPKGKKSAKDILEAVKKNKSIFLLIDQKDSAGELINFFNYKVKTQTGFLKIANKYKMDLIPVQNIRKKNNNFSLIFHKSIKINESDLIENVQMKKIHAFIEKWIIHEPSQWFWQHNRFN